MDNKFLLDSKIQVILVGDGANTVKQQCKNITRSKDLAKHINIFN